MLQKELVPYKLALEMAKLGFDEPCFMAHYQPDNSGSELVDFDEEVTVGGYYTKAPTYSQCFRFFRDKYRIWCEITSQIGLKHHSAQILPQGGWFCKNVSSYEETELLCLQKLIEEVKNYLASIS